MTRILMVCLGNICRSPLAEGILQSKVNPKEVVVDSAGLGGYHVGELPDKRSIQVAEEHSLNIANQRARQFQLSDFEDFDIIYAMDQQNRDRLLEMAPTEEAKRKVKMILDEVFPGESLEVPDPYYDAMFAFRNVYKMLDEACNSIAQKIE